MHRIGKFDALDSLVLHGRWNGLLRQLTVLSLSGRTQVVTASISHETLAHLSRRIYCDDPRHLDLTCTIDFAAISLQRFKVANVDS